MQLDNAVHVFGSREIPFRDAAGGTRFREFAAHPVLGRLLPAAGQVALVWIEGREHQIVERTVDLDTMVLVLRGTAQLCDGNPLAAGDVMTVPAASGYRFTVTAPGGLEAVAVTFAPTPAESVDPEDVSSLPALLRRNRQRIRRVSRGPMFALVDDGTLNDPAVRDEFLRRIRPLSDTFQKIIIARQATCTDHAYEFTFLQHLVDEFGHNALLPTDEVAAQADPVMNATLAWFTHQMLVRDNAEKAVLVHLVLEAAAEAFFTKSATREVFGAAGAMDYYRAHLEDEAHKDLLAQLLAGLHPHTYRRLHRMLEDGWDMFDAMGIRLAELVRGAAAGAP